MPYIYQSAMGGMSSGYEVFGPRGDVVTLSGSFHPSWQEPTVLPYCNIGLGLVTFVLGWHDLSVSGFAGSFYFVHVQLEELS